MTIYLLFYLILIVGPFSILLHESGHAAAARVVKADRITVSIGYGKLLSSAVFERFQLNVHMAYFLGGFARSERGIPYKSSEMIWIAVSGPIANGLFTCLLYFIYVIYPNAYIQLLCLFNLWLTVINIIPFRIKEKQTDGYTILEELKKCLLKYKN